MNITSAGRYLGIAVSLAGIAVVVVGVLVLVARARVEDDAKQVYCLAPVHREELVHAADALGLAEPGRAAGRLSVDGGELTPAAWRDRSEDDFDRACAALSAAQRPAAVGLFATVLPFLTGLVGAVAAFAAAAWRDRVTRGRTLADDLRAATDEFVRAAEDYLADWLPDRSDVEVVARREKLATQLARAAAAHRGWTAVARVRRGLDTGPLGPEFSEGWRSGDGWEARDRERVTRLRALLGTTRDDIFRIADALEQPVLARAAMRSGGGS